ncbi:MAG TPA: signal peptidase I, partial [Thermoanaerobaculia bacterium]|nr:signal peptidase I [Thermoanaerobaculia bacterium]
FAAAGFAAAILLALVLGVVVLRTMFYKTQQVAANMEPAIAKGDTVVIRRATGTISRGDVVGVTMPPKGRLALMRVIALPGEVVELREGLAVVNGVALDEPYAWLSEGAEPKIMVVRNLQPVQVPAGAFFVLGDNRDNANDSRFIGFVKRGDIRGRAVLVISETRGVRRP